MKFAKPFKTWQQKFKAGDDFSEALFTAAEIKIIQDGGYLASDAPAAPAAPAAEPAHEETPAN